jgi:hypothetical protein
MTLTFGAQLLQYFVVFQHTPLELIAAPPSLVIVPPHKAVVHVMSIILKVVKAGTASFLQEWIRKKAKMRKMTIKILCLFLIGIS